MAAPMRVIARHAEMQGNSVSFANATRDVESLLRKNGLLPGVIRDRYRTTMPLTEFDLEAAVPFSIYAKQHVSRNERHLSRKEMPKMSRALQGKFYEGLQSFSPMRPCAQDRHF
jgi:hypothetical protein